jgi:hypothetical protein
MEIASYTKAWKRPFSKLKEVGLMAAAVPCGYLGLLNNFPKNPTFIVGSPRSGTSILRRIISLHPDVTSYSEAIWVWDYRDMNSMRDHLKLSKDVSVSDANRIRWTFGLWQKLQNKPIFLNKNPRSSVRISYIKEIFPDGKIIHIVRDGRAVVHSVITRIRRESWREKIPLGAFCKPPNWRTIYKLPMIERHAYQWTGIIEEINRQKQTVEPKNWLEIRYEDLCSDTEAVLDKIFSFLAIEVTPRQKEKMSELTAPLHWHWKQNIEKKDIEKMSTIMRKWLAYYGYLEGSTEQ